MTTYDKQKIAYVRETMVGESPAPSSEVGIVHWVMKNLFSSIPNAILTLLGAYFVYTAVSGLLNFTIFGATWSGEDRNACIAPLGGHGACWPYVKANFQQFMILLIIIGIKNLNQL